ncbi:MAG: hypothetical protein WDN26_12050 [Chitinophagaceae bacterium]
MRPFDFAPTTFVGASRVIPIAIGSDAIVDTSTLLNREQENERSVATGDDSSNAAGYIIILPQLAILLHKILLFVKFDGKSKEELT